MRAIGVDLGSKRIGLALSNSEGTVAVPYEVVYRTNMREKDHRRIIDTAVEVGAERIVIGMPYSLDGSVGPAAKRAQAEVRLLRKATEIQIDTYDERLSTVTADRSLREMSLGAAERRKMVDAVAASVILQGWLDQISAVDRDLSGSPQVPKDSSK